MAEFPRGRRWGKLMAAGEALAPRVGTPPGALDPGNRGWAPDFSTNKEKSAVTRHTL